MAVAALIILIVLMVNIGRWLSDADSPEMADAIVVLAGAPERTMYAADLYRKHYSREVLISRPAKEGETSLLFRIGIKEETEEHLDRRILIRMGVPASHIKDFGEGSLSTVDEAYALKRATHGMLHRVLIVTSPYHVLRAKLVFRRAFRGTGTRIVVVATPYEKSVVHWWRSQQGARNVVLEMAKLAFYMIGGRFTHSTNHRASIGQ